MVYNFSKSSIQKLVLNFGKADVTNVGSDTYIITVKLTRNIEVTVLVYVNCTVISVYVSSVE